jgi:hypothetical protein
MRLTRSTESRRVSMQEGLRISVAVEFIVFSFLARGSLSGSRRDASNQEALAYRSIVPSDLIVREDEP